MFKSRPENDHPVPSLEELAYWREQELGKEKAALRRRGSGRIRLEPWRGELAKLLGRATLPVPEIRDLLAKMGTEVNVKTLFKFLREEMTEEYEAYLEKTGTGRSKKAAPSQTQISLDANEQQGETVYEPTPEATHKSDTAEIPSGSSLLDAANPRKLGVKK